MFFCAFIDDDTTLALSITIIQEPFQVVKELEQNINILVCAAYGPHFSLLKINYIAKETLKTSIIIILVCNSAYLLKYKEENTGS